MLINLVAWIYISFICLILGNMLLAFFGGTRGLHPKFRDLHSAIPNPGANAFLLALELPFICLTGLAMTGILALWLSLLMPLDWKAHCIIVFPAFCHCLKKTNRHIIRMQVNGLTNHFSRTGYWLLAACILMTLVITAHDIDHPDTLFYHARSILLFERYKPIPGIANLRLQLGFQSFWFASLTIFKTDATNFYNVIFLNGAVLCWYFLFVIGRIDKEWLKKKEGLLPGKTNEWAWLLLLAFSLISWTQVRLTAASASPDFTVTLYTWASIYIFFHLEDKKGNRDIYAILVFLFCFTALLIKLSAALLLVLALASIVRCFRVRPVRSTIVYSLAALIMLTPLFIRNRIASGYLLYPSSVPDVFKTDWKPELPTMHLLEHYISAYARLSVDIAEAELQLHAPYSQWIPIWWHNISPPDRLLIAGIIFGIIAFIFQFLKGKLFPAGRTKRATPETGNTYRVVIFLVTITGSLLWFLKAPDPRFGVGFLIPLLYFLYLRSSLPNILSVKGISIAPAGFASRVLPGKIASWILMSAVTFYSGYRFINFFSADEFIHPAGIQKSAYEPLGCKGLKIDLLGNKIDRQGIISLSCKDDYTGGFLLRGQTIDEGFKPFPLSPH